LKAYAGFSVQPWIENSSSEKKQPA